MKAVILFGLVLSGCAAQMMQSSGESQYAPLNERRGGQVRYLAAGIPPVQRARREDAYKQMWEKCDGRYNVVSEFSENAGAITHSVGSSTTAAHMNSSGSAVAYGTGGAAFANGESTTTGSATTNSSGTSFTQSGSWRYINFECADAPPDNSPKARFRDLDSENKIGELVNCPPGRVLMQGMTYIDGRKRGLQAIACDKPVSCVQEGNGMSCEDDRPAPESLSAEH